VEILWTISIPITKLSLLLLYVRVFGTLRYIRIFGWCLGIFTIAWAIMVVIVASVQCIPIEAFWDPSVHGICINSWLFYIAGSCPNTATDLLILILPLPAVWRLQMDISQRVLVTGIFMLGSLTCAISLVRLISLLGKKFCIFSPLISLTKLRKHKCCRSNMLVYTHSTTKKTLANFHQTTSPWSCCGLQPKSL
jgi:hypothetical protein